MADSNEEYEEQQLQMEPTKPGVETQPSMHAHQSVKTRDQLAALDIETNDRDPTTTATATAVVTATTSRSLHLSLTSMTSFQAAVQQNSQYSWFKQLMSIQSFQKHIDVEFETFNPFILLKAFVTIYVISLFDIITDILMALTVTFSGDCIPLILGNGAHILIVIAAWFSTITAIIYSFWFKYIKAFKVMYKYKLSFWSAIKYVSLYTALKCDMDYGKISNDTNRYRLMNLFFEDFLQVIIGIVISFQIPKADVWVILSMYLSAAAICYVSAKMIQWRLRDYIHKNCTKCFDKCAHIGVNKVLGFCCKYVVFGALAFAVAILLLVPIWRSYQRFEQTVYADYGFIMADVEYQIDYLQLSKGSNFTIENNILTTTIDEDFRYLCIDSEENQFKTGVDFDDSGDGVFINNDSYRPMPVVCFKSNKERLRMYFFYDDFVHVYQSKKKLEWTENGKILNGTNDFMFYESWSDDQIGEISLDPQWLLSYSSTKTAFCDDF